MVPRVRHFLPSPFRPSCLHPIITRNLKRALNLANIVADSRYRLYDDFLGIDIDDELGPLQKQLEEQQAQLLGKKRVRKTRLGDYLSAVRQAVLGGLEGGGSDPFAMVAIKVIGSVRA
jgi:nuclear pore complex protein Nup107